ncbi:LON peptidase substrate-binding domain-containing protein [Fluctibacter corallii]
MPLRIFEPRYTRMIKEACANDSGFGMCMLNAAGSKEDNTHIYPIGTYAKVTDFDLLEDGLLGVTVEGKSCIAIESISQEDDGLRLGECYWLGNWHEQPASTQMGSVNDKLKELFNAYPEVGRLYPSPKFEDPAWVMFRWLELLPIDAEQKQRFLIEKDYSKVLNYLTHLME